MIINIDIELYIVSVSLFMAKRYRGKKIARNFNLVISYQQTMFWENSSTPVDSLLLEESTLA
jgi:hypothetical protein